MDRDWPAADVAHYIMLIDDPRHRVNADGTYRLSETQARAILDLRLQRLTALGRDEIGEEMRQLGESIKDYLDILRSRARIVTIVKDELMAVRDEFATPRRTEILDVEGDVDDEDLIQREDMVVTVSHRGYIKRVPLSTYRAQRRGGKGRSGMATRDEDFVTRLFIANTHTPLLFFSSRGMVYKMKVWRLPLAAAAGARQGADQSPAAAAGRVRSPPSCRCRKMRPPGPSLNVMFATSAGDVRRNDLSDFVEVRQNGKIAMKLDEGVQIVGVDICTENDNVLLTTAGGQSIRFPVGDVRVFKGRESTGVRGVRLDGGDR